MSMWFPYFDFFSCLRANPFCISNLQTTFSPHYYDYVIISRRITGIIFSETAHTLNQTKLIVLCEYMDMLRKLLYYQQKSAGIFTVNF